MNIGIENVVRALWVGIAVTGIAAALKAAPPAAARTEGAER